MDTITSSLKVAVVPSGVGVMVGSVLPASLKSPVSGTVIDITGSTPKLTLVLDESEIAEAELDRREPISVSAMPPPPEGCKGYKKGSKN